MNVAEKLEHASGSFSGVIAAEVDTPYGKVNLVHGRWSSSAREACVTHLYMSGTDVTVVLEGHARAAGPELETLYWRKLVEVGGQAAVRNVLESVCRRAAEEAVEEHRRVGRAWLGLVE